MSWSWDLGSIAGIRLRMHWTFLLLIVFIIYMHLSQGDTLAGAAVGVLLVLAIFACIVLHELGHALAARRYGVPTRDITLLPIGGVARLQRMPEHPVQELVVAIAGPAVNVVIAIVLAALLLPMVGLLGVAGSLEGLGVAPFLGKLLLVNLFLVVFNMLPAFPMDGGRVFRALLATQLDYVRATTIAAKVGQAMAILFVVAGLLIPNVFLVFIALFVYLGADAEARTVQTRALLGDLPVREAMITRYQTLSPHDTLGTAVDLLLAGSQQDFPVIDDGRLHGILRREDLVQHLNASSREAKVEQAMQTGCPRVAPRDMLYAVMERLRESNCSTVPVVQDERLIGLITLENIGELMMVREAVGAGKG